jgi:hypothetical protein
MGVVDHQSSAAKAEAPDRPLGVTAEICFRGRRWLLLECSYLRRNRFLRQISCRQGVREAIVLGSSIGRVLQRAIDWTAQIIKPTRFDYRRFDYPDLA